MNAPVSFDHIHPTADYEQVVETNAAGWFTDSMEYVPLSVRESRRFSRKRVGWWAKGQREALALKLAPWLRYRR